MAPTTPGNQLMAKEPMPHPKVSSKEVSESPLKVSERRSDNDNISSKTNSGIVKRENKLSPSVASSLHLASVLSMLQEEF